MSRPLPVPAELRRGAFTLDDARRAGVDQDQLRSASFRRVGPAIYTWIHAPDDRLRLLIAIASRLPKSAAFAGRAAAWLTGVDVRPEGPIDVVVPISAPVSGRAGVRFHRAQLEPSEVAVRQGLRATVLLRTLSDIAQWEPLEEAVAAADIALNKRLLTVAALRQRVAQQTGRWGVARFRRVVELADPLAESAMETRLRLLLVLAGLPAPEVQVKLTAPDGTVVARADLYYPEARLIVEYDGDHHRHRIAEDNRRQNALLAAGYQILRFTASDVLGNPKAVVAQVAAALTSPRFPGKPAPNDGPTSRFPGNRPQTAA